MTQILRKLPPVNELLEEESIRELIGLYSRDFVLLGVQDLLDDLRGRVRDGSLSEADLAGEVDALASTLKSRLEASLSASLREVINATGVIVHTNLGRAPLARPVAAAVEEAALGYSNLEYDLGAGKRGHRDRHFEDRMRRLVSCGAATVCNNNAAAVLLILNTLASGRKVLVSRGELVEIGGSFRIPAIMEKSGAVLREVGTTNKTRLSDYREAIDDQTALILRVHPSNYKVVGFTARPEVEELVDLARETRLPLAEDLGSGLLFDSPQPFLGREPSVVSTLRAGADLACFSGDKLLGGPQAGIIVGREDLVDRIRKNPLMRACRVDKMTYTALDRTLSEYQKGTFRESIPVQSMLAARPEDIRVRSEKVAGALEEQGCSCRILEGFSLTGGGSAPEERIPTALIAVTCPDRSVNELERLLRQSAPPVLARIENDELILDLRTVFVEQESLILSAFSRIASG